jgi:hypothetical protein
MLVLFRHDNLSNSLVSLFFDFNHFASLVSAAAGARVVGEAGFSAMRAGRRIWSGNFLVGASFVAF